MTRRQALSLPLLTLRGLAQETRGMASRGVKPQPRGKPSGLPFHAHFVNVAEAAGLTAPVIYGGVDHAEYIIETMGCGAAFMPAAVRASLPSLGYSIRPRARSDPETFLT